MHYISVKQLSERLGGVSKASLYRWAREDGDFPKPVKLGPGCTRWRLADIEAWEKSREAAA